MLASLLPGVRRLRTPLATGYLWIVALWMLVHQYVPTKLKDASGPIKSLFQLGTIVGATVALGIVGDNPEPQGSRHRIGRTPASGLDLA